MSGFHRAGVRNVTDVEKHSPYVDRGQDKFPEHEGNRGTGSGERRRSRISEAASARTPAAMDAAKDFVHPDHDHVLSDNRIENAKKKIHAHQPQDPVSSGIFGSKHRAENPLRDGDRRQGDQPNGDDPGRQIEANEPRGGEARRSEACAAESRPADPPMFLSTSSMRLIQQKRRGVHAPGRQNRQSA